MERSFVLLLGLALLLLAVNRSSADTEVDVKANVIASSNPNSSFTNAKPGGSKLVSNDTDAKNLDHGANKKDKQSSLAENDDLGEGNGDVPEHRDNNGENKVGEITGSDETSKEAVTTLTRKEGFHGEECDPSNRCTDKEDQFVACLRVPGNDSPHLSLLIQNKGKVPLLVVISAPGFVRLEKNKVELPENEDVKVTVSIGSGGFGNNSIILRAAKGQCSLDLRDLLSQNTVNDDSIASSHSSFFNLPSQALAVIIFIVLALILVPASVHIYRSKFQGKRYQRLDMELPVSDITSKPDKEANDGWNDDWDDYWGDDDDEETPRTPTLAVTPRVSSRGLASRRLSKEGWKD